MKTILRKSGFLTIVFLIANMFFASMAFGQTLTSDQPDYAPGTTATFTGSGFQPGEQVKIEVLHPDDTPDTGEDHIFWYVEADADGNFVTTWHVCEDDCLGSTLRATADGQTSGLHADVVFTDGTAQIASVTEGIISPANNDATKDNTSIVGENQGGGELANFGIKIHATTASGTIVKDLYSIALLAANTQTSNQIWNGEDNSNVNVPDGIYFAVAGSGAIYTENTAANRIKQIIVDNTNPTITLNAPIASAVVNGTIDFTVSPLDAGGNDSNIDKIEFYLNGNPIGTDASSNSGWKISYNTTGISDGAYTWYAKVFDKAGNNSTSVARAVSVVNATSGSIASVAIGGQSFASVYGTASTPSYNITSVRGSSGTVNGTYSVTGLPAGVTFSFAPSATFTANGTTAFPGVTLTLNVPTNLNAGSYNFTVSLSDGSNTVIAIGMLVVNKAVLTATADPQTKVYGAANPSPLTATISGFVLGQTLGTSGVTGTASVTTTADANSAVGSYTLTAALGTLASDNYSFSFVDGSLAVTKALLTVTADPQTKVYGAANPSPLTATIGGFVLGQTLGTSGVTGTASVTTTADANSAVGSYTLTAALGTLASSNYSFSYTNGSLAVTKAPLTVTADVQTKVYGAANPSPLTATISGFVLLQNLGNSGITGTASVTTTADVNSPVGSYTLTAAVGTLSSSNYSFSYTNGSLAVIKAPLIVTADAQTKVYGAANPSPLTATISGFVLGQNLASSGVTGTASVTTTATASSPVNSYTLTAALGTLASANYSFSYVAGTLNVTKAPLTVTADPQTKVYGEANDALTFQYSGWQNTDDATDLTTAPTTSTTVNLATSVGVHTDAITLVGGADENYDFTYVAADYEVTKAMLTVAADAQTKVYDGSVYSPFTVTYNGFITGEDETNLGGGLSYSGTGTTAINVGTNYVITPSGLTSGNYDITFVAGKLDITQKALTITASDKSKVYDGSVYSPFTATYNGFITGETETVLGETLAYSGSATTAVNVGTNYVITPSGLTSGNYDITFVAGKLDINTADACVTYNGDLFKSTGSSSGGSTTVTLSVVIAKNPSTDPGDIGTALIQFFDGSTPIPTTTYPLMKTSTPTQVTYSIEYLVSLNGALSKTLDIKWEITGNYSPNALCSESMTAVTVSAATADFSTGGGYVFNDLSRGKIGIKAGEPKSKNNFGYNVKWNKSLSNLQGNFNTIIRCGDKLYQVKSNKPSYLLVSDKKSATITYINAVIQDLTSFKNGVCTYPSIFATGCSEGGGTVILQVIDNGEPSSTGTDMIAITIKDKNGKLFYASNTGTVSSTTSSTPLIKVEGNSNIQVRTGTSTTSKISDASLTLNNVKTKDDFEPTPFDVKVYPNPTQDQFALVVEGGSNEKVEVLVYDSLGRMVKQIDNSDGQQIKFGEELPSGAYIAIVSQGINQKTVNLIKQ